MSAMSPHLPWAFQAVSAPPLSASGLSNEGNSAICVWCQDAGDGASVGVCDAFGGVLPYINWNAASFYVFI